MKQFKLYKDSNMNIDNPASDAQIEYINALVRERRNADFVISDFGLTNESCMDKNTASKLIDRLLDKERRDYY